MENEINDNRLVEKAQSRTRHKVLVLIVLAAMLAVFGMFIITGCGEETKLLYQVFLPALNVEGVYKLEPHSPTKGLDYGAEFNFSITFDKDVDKGQLFVMANATELHPLEEDENAGGGTETPESSNGESEPEIQNPVKEDFTYNYQIKVTAPTTISLHGLPEYFHVLQMQEGVTAEFMLNEVHNGDTIFSGYELIVTYNCEGYTNPVFNVVGLTELKRERKGSIYTVTYMVNGKTDGVADGPVIVAWEGTPKQYTLGTIPPEVSVKAGDVELHTNDAIYRGQELTITPSVELEEPELYQQVITVQGAKHKEGDIYEVTGNVSATYKVVDRPTLDKLEFSKPDYAECYNVWGNEKAEGRIVIPGEYDDGIHGKLPVRVENWAFRDNGRITSVVFLEGVVYIDTGAFAGCTSLQQVSLPSTLYYLGDNLFSGSLLIEVINNSQYKLDTKIQNALVVVDESQKGDFDKVYNGVRYYENTYKNVRVALGIEAGESDVSDITFENNTVAIANYAFNDCTQITSVTMPDSIKIVGICAFKGCSGLNNINMPTNLQELGKEAFQGCSNLNSISLPDIITKIEELTFEKCSNLTSVKLPKNLKVIGKNAFYDCVSLMAVEFPKGLETLEYGAFFGCESLVSVELPEKLTSMENAVFSRCYALTNLKLPSSLKEIPYEAFIGCKALKDLVLPEGLIRIGGYAFQGCENLRSVTLPTTLQEIGYVSFSSCKRLIEIVNKSQIQLTPGDDAYGPTGGIALRKYVLILDNESQKGKFDVVRDVYTYYENSYLDVSILLDVASGTQNVVLEKNTIAVGYQALAKVVSTDSFFGLKSITMQEKFRMIDEDACGTIFPDVPEITLNSEWAYRDNLVGLGLLLRNPRHIRVPKSIVDNNPLPECLNAEDYYQYVDSENPDYYIFGKQ